MNQQLSAPRPQPEIEPPQAGCPDSKIIDKKARHAHPADDTMRGLTRCTPSHGMSHVGSETATLKPA